MSRQHPKLEDVSRPLAWVIAAVLTALLVGGLMDIGDAARITAVQTDVAQESGDLALYRAVRDRLKGGEHYYDALGTELRARNFPTGSVFNWRPPLHLWLESKLAPAVSKALLGACAVFCLILALQVLHGQGRVAASISVILMLAALSPVVIGQAHLLSEVWAAAFMTCSALFLASGRWKPAVLAGLVAVLLRELVVLYIIVALTIALFRGDRRQAVAWTGVLAVFAVYLGLHALEVGARLTDLDLRHDGGWIQFGGLGFVLATVRMQPLLLIAPAAVTAIYLPLTVLGLLAWEDRKALVLRATCIGFIAAFLVVGRPVNYYWGFLYAPLLALGVGWSARGGKALAAALGIYPRLLGSAGWP